MGAGHAAPPADEPVKTGRRARIHTGELISAASALALLPIMFLLEWFGTVGLPRVRSTPSIPAAAPAPAPMAAPSPA